jgi:hypothetical protein
MGFVVIVHGEALSVKPQRYDRPLAKSLSEWP